jgi:DNA-binding response OmpR family regulator
VGQDNRRRGSISARLDADTRVLVVEDEHDIADFLRAYLRASGFAFTHLDPDSPEAVVAAVADLEPACVLLDVRLRGFSGLEAYELIRADDRFRFIPVILVTADGSAKLRATGIANELDAGATKPFSMKALTELVTGRIERARALAEAAGD